MRKRGILFVPLEPADTGNIHRGAAMARALSWRYRVTGISRQPGFPTFLPGFSYVKLLEYWMRVLRLGLQRSTEIDVIFCENIHVVVGAILALLTGKPCIWDVETESSLYMSAWRRSRLFAALHYALEHFAWGRVRILIVACDDDRRRFVARGFEGDRIRVVPNAVDASRVEAALRVGAAETKECLGMAPGDPLLLFSGNRGERPNAEAADWVNRHLAPVLGQHYPRARIVLTGRGAPPQPLAPNVVVTGYVSDIYPYVAAADICLAPLWSVTGVPGKVIEYMVLGKPIVGTMLIRGVPELEDGVTALLARDGNEFKARVLELLGNAELRRILGTKAAEAGRRYILQRVAEECLYPIVEEVDREKTVDAGHLRAQ